MHKLSKYTTTWINGQRGIWLDPEDDPSGVAQVAIGKACAAWVSNNGCIQAFLQALRSAGYLMVLVEPGNSMEAEADAKRGAS
jgi:hypothetical protein